MQNFLSVSLDSLYMLTRAGLTVTGRDMGQIREIHRQAGWVPGEKTGRCS